MINHTIAKNDYLTTRNVQAFAHEQYVSGEQRHKTYGTIENLVVSLKNEYNDPISSSKFVHLTARLRDILNKDLAYVVRESGFINRPLIVTVPRSKANLQSQQLLFYSTVSQVVDSMAGQVDNGTCYIKRVVDTATTHKRNWQDNIDSGSMPYKGITKKTCKISNSVRGQQIILIDDLYTPGVNIDEDALQALFDNGASDIVFYSLGVIIRENISDLPF